MQSEITYNFEASITLIPTQDGGRKRGIFSGYKPSFVFNGERQYCGEIELADNIELLPGQSGIAKIHLLPAKTIPKRLHVNSTFALYEGNKIIGTGYITNLVSKQETLV